MDDIVIRLKIRAEIRQRIRSEEDRIARDLLEAANEIEKLRGEVAYLQQKVC